MTYQLPGKSALLLALLSLGPVLSSEAGTLTAPTVTAPPEAAATTSAFDDLWSLFTLYKSDTGFLNELRVIGRYHGQYGYADGETEDYDEWLNRRTRLGLKARMLDKQLTLNAEAQSSPKYDPAYLNLTDVYLDWKPKEGGFNWRLGKWQPHFANEFDFSSKEILTMERSAFVNQFGISHTPGVRVGSDYGPWSWNAAVFTNQTDSEFGQLDGGWSTLATVRYDAKEAFGAEKAEFKLDWMHSEHEAGDNRLFYFDDSVALSYTGKSGAVGLNGNVIGATGSRGDALAFMVMPSYDFTKKLQGVARYELAFGSDASTLQPLPIYERGTGATSGDLYQAGYLGLNYYIYGQHLKLMGGVQYSQMSGGKVDADTFSAIVGVRIAL